MAANLPNNGTADTIGAEPNTAPTTNPASASQPTTMPKPPGRLAGRVAFVTGSSSGLGAAICIAFAAEGAVLFCVDLHPSPRAAFNRETMKVDDINVRIRGQGTHEQILQSGGEATYYRADLTRARDVELAVRACVSKYGRIDIAVNNAGISYETTRLRPLRVHETSEDDFDRTMAVNCKGVFLGCKYELKQMLEQTQKYRSRGWIINTASIYATAVAKGIVSYSASKGACLQITKQIALDYAKDLIHCNCLSPGYLETAFTVQTRNTPETFEYLKRRHPFGNQFGKVEDVAKAAVFLASDDCAWVTGVSLPVDGGYLIS